MRNLQCTARSETGGIASTLSRLDICHGAMANYRMSLRTESGLRQAPAPAWVTLLDVVCRNGRALGRVPFASNLPYLMAHTANPTCTPSRNPSIMKRAK